MCPVLHVFVLWINQDGDFVNLYQGDILRSLGVPSDPADEISVGHRSVTPRVLCSLRHRFSQEICWWHQ